jgi:hypothetical protein
VADDFADLRRAGFAHPMTTEIERALRHWSGLSAASVPIGRPQQKG